MGIRRWVAVVMVAAGVVVVAGCDGGAKPGGTSGGTSTGASAAGGGSSGAVPGSSCPPDNRYGGVMAAGGEVAGTPGVFWALLFLRGERLPAGEQVKIALRVTGSGELTLSAVGPGGATVEPQSFDSHDGSTWDRPGDEWGSYWVFPTAGCWTLRAERTDGTRGAVTLRAG